MIFVIQDTITVAEVVLDSLSSFVLKTSVEDAVVELMQTCYICYYHTD